MPKLLDIVQEQTRALRVRSFVGYLRRNRADQNKCTGMYLQIGSDPTENLKSKELLQQRQWLNQNSIEKAATYKTTLRKFKQKDFELIARHGYETFLWNQIIHGPTAF